MPMRIHTLTYQQLEEIVAKIHVPSTLKVGDFIDDIYRHIFTYIMYICGLVLD